MEKSSVVETVRTCDECDKALDDYLVSNVKNGKRGVFHYRCAGDLSGFSTWHVMIDPDYDDGEYRAPYTFEFDVSADSREGAIEAALARFKVEEHSGIYAYRVTAFPESEWNAVLIRKPGEKA